MSNVDVRKIDKNLFSSKSYKLLNKIIIIIYALFMLLYMSRENLYKLDNQYITLLAWILPNLVPSFLFSIIGIFYIIPKLFKMDDAINKTIFIWIINGVNMVVFAGIEYAHVAFTLGVWDNKDMIASLIGIIIATIIYFRFRKFFVNEI